MAGHRIPPELWLQFINEATASPVDALNTDQQVYNPLPPHGVGRLSPEKNLASLISAFAAKRTISLVCRMWKSLCADSLHEFILVRDAAQIPSLLQKVQDGGIDPAKIQRIDFVCRVSKRGIPPEDLAISAAKLISLCPRLRILSSNTPLWNSYAIVDQVLQKALMYVVDSLEYIEWHSRWHWDIYFTLYLCSLYMPRLKVLKIYHPTIQASHEGVIDKAEDSEWIRDDESSAVGCPIPPRISSCLVGYAHRQVRRYNIANVNSVLSWSWYSPPTSALKHIIAEPNAYLEAIMVGSPWIPKTTIYTLPRDAFSHVCGHDIAALRTIKTIIIHLRDLPIRIPQMPVIQHIGLMASADKAPSPGEYDHAFNVLLEKNLFPCLQVIRFVDPSLARTLEKRRIQLKLWEYRCRSKGVRLEDETGRQMSSPSL